MLSGNYEPSWKGIVLYNILDFIIVSLKCLFPDLKKAIICLHGVVLKSPRPQCQNQVMTFKLSSARLTTESSMVLMPLWLMSSVVRFLHTGMTAVTGQPDSAPSASHCENSLASGTRMDWRRPETTRALETRRARGRGILAGDSPSWFPWSGGDSEWPDSTSETTDLESAESCTH